MSEEKSNTIAEEQREKARKQAQAFIMQHRQIQVNHIKKILERHKNRPDIAVERIYNYLGVE